MASDLEFMQMALEEAQLAADENEVPVGAVFVHEQTVLARKHNKMVKNKDPLAHAELLALRTATAVHPGKWLMDATLYVTLEPCAMCTGALVLARVKRLVFATPDPKAGACGSIMDLARHPKLNHRLEVESGLLQNEASEMLTSFFRRLRQGPS
jgi:tRNA(Arg) A34 adenosine deaminase TadA